MFFILKNEPSFNTFEDNGWFLFTHKRQFVAGFCISIKVAFLSLCYSPLLPTLQSDSGSSTNTADRILDLLKEQRSQQLVLRKYRSCGEPTKVKCAVWRGKGNAEHTPLSPDR